MTTARTKQLAVVERHLRPRTLRLVDGEALAIALLGQLQIAPRLRHTAQVERAVGDPRLVAHITEEPPHPNAVRVNEAGLLEYFDGEVWAAYVDLPDDDPGPLGVVLRRESP
ncbi:hypothetical protein OHN15_37050 [Streptomyces sp. NBC_00624]|nr:hypothetical protein OIE76_38440 [Streptomyces sp. NBC_01727]